MSFPNFSNFKQYIKDELKLRKDATLKISNLNSWIKITSGNDEGLSMVSNPNHKLFKAAGQTSGIYGDSKSSGTIGTNWAGNDVNSGTGQGFKPSPIVSSMEIDEGSGTLSRKGFIYSITAFHTRANGITIAGILFRTRVFCILRMGMEYASRSRWNCRYNQQQVKYAHIPIIACKRNELRRIKHAMVNMITTWGLLLVVVLQLDGDKWNYRC